MTVERREAPASLPGLEYVLSDGTLDRFGTVINPAGWELDEFRKNPIAFFNHNKDFPIGTWDNVRVEGGRLLAKLRLAVPGTSARIDEIASLIRQGIVKAVSVGFRPKAREPLKRSDGTPIEGALHYTRQELLEASVVGVPGNSNALQLVARSMNISDETMSIVFGEQAKKNAVAGVGSAAGHGSTPPVRKNTAMNIPLSKRIEDAQARVVALKDQLTEHLTTIGDEPDDAASVITEDLNGKIGAAQRSLDGLKEAETRLSSQSEVVTRGNGNGNSDLRRPFAMPAPKVEPRQYVFRAAAIKVLSHVHKKDPEVIRQQFYGDHEETRIVSDFMLTRAASAPATTTTSGWASQLVQTVIADFMEHLMPAAVYPGLSAKGLRLNFGRNGVVSIPSRAATPTIAGSFVAEGAPIPVRQGAFTATTLTPKKLAVISTFTREIAQHSTPAIEGLIRDAIQEDTSVAVDTVLLDATAASAIRPAGIRNGVTVTTATAGGGFAALVGDIKALVGALVTATAGNIRAPVWIMNPVQALAISLTQNAGGDFPFAAEINGGRFQGYPLIQSPTVTAGMVILADAADFVSVEGDEPLFDVSDQATLHMEDTTPLAIGTAGAPPTVAAPVRSLWQTDTIGIRMILPMNWAFRRTGMLVWTESVTW